MSYVIMYSFKEDKIQGDLEDIITTVLDVNLSII